MKSIRIDKYLADMGKGTRSELKKMIRGGAVTIDGVVVKKPEEKVIPGEQKVFLAGTEVGYSKMEYYVLNKPAGCVSATEDNVHKTVMDYIISDRKSELFPVGRLDLDTEGLLLITNDGPLAHALLSPRHHVEKTYIATLNAPATEEMVEQFKNGIEIGEKNPTLPAKLKILSDRQAEITISEGKFHQVKRMFHAVGREVVALRRIQMGSLRLEESLLPGKYRALTEEELTALRMEAGMSGSDRNRN